MKVFIAITILSSLGLLQACAPQPSAPEPRCGFVMTWQAQRVSWGERAPVMIYLDSTVPTASFAAIENAANRWNQVLGRPVLKIVGSSSSFSQERQDGVSVVYFRSNWSDSEQMKRKQAITTIHWTANQIFEADIAVNTRHFAYAYQGVPAQNEVDLESLMVHEFGHMLGLDHELNLDRATVMAEKLPSGTTRRDVSAADVNNLKCEY